jgi:hypothetical protein
MRGASDFPALSVGLGSCLPAYRGHGVHEHGPAQTKQTPGQRALQQPSIGQRLALAHRTEHCHQHSVEVIGSFDALCR